MKEIHPAERSPGFFYKQPATVSGDRPRFLGGRLDKASLFWILQCGGWIAFGAVMFAWGLSYWSPADTLVNKALLVSTGFTLTLAARSFYRKARARSLPHVASSLLVGTVSFAGAAIWFEAHIILLRIYYSTINGEKIAVAPVAIPFGTLLYDGFVLLAWSLLYYGINDWVELEKERERAAKAEAMAHAARLQALQSQLEPHFLFNTLNAISTLVLEGQNSVAVRMITRLSDFLRLTLDAAETPEISVAEELEFVRRYLEIEQVRFGNRLRVLIDADPNAMQGLVPALVLQPLVENAVKHGVLPRELGGSVAVTIAKSDGILRISVVDNGDGLTKDSMPPHGVGLSNTAARLAELYGQESRLSLRSSGNGGVEAMIEIPFRTAKPRFDDDGTRGERK